MIILHPEEIERLITCQKIIDTPPRREPMFIHRSYRNGYTTIAVRRQINWTAARSWGTVCSETQMNKASICIIILFIFLLTNCSGPDGRAYQKYTWGGSLVSFADTNPSTPNTVLNDVYFPTSSGKYYMEYTSWDGSRWFLYYTITIEEGGLFNKSGEDQWFSIYLLSTGPSLIKLHSPRLISDQQIEKTLLQTNENKTLSKFSGTETLNEKYGSITITWGQILEN